MRDDRSSQSPLVRPYAAGSPRTCIAQAGAICYRTAADGTLEVLLVASRRNGRWGVPKGCIEAGERSGAAAAREALEEAGVRGTVSTAAIGAFVYSKDGSGISYHLAIHLLEVTETLADFPEKKTRRLRWAPFETAVKDVSHPRIRDLLLSSIGSPRDRRSLMDPPDVLLA